MRSAVIALGIAAAVALPVSAQRVAAEIALVESAAPAGAVVLGEVRAEIHQGTLFAKTPARDLADNELRAQAAKLGADAVVDIRYEANPPLFSKKGFRAAGKAVKFVQVAAAAPPPVPEAGGVAAIAPTEPVGAPSAPPAPAVVASAPPPVAAPAPQIAAVAPAPGPVVAASPPAIASVPTPQATRAPPPPEPVAPPLAPPGPVAAAAIPAAPRGPTPEAMIVLTEQDLAGRGYDRLGEVKAEARQMSLFPKKSARVLLDEQLRAKAAAVGADAVILVRYETYSPLTSKKGASASGVAVKYR
jgi:uncharacterized protein YbjQ (UPF0145 family)